MACCFGFWADSGGPLDSRLRKLETGSGTQNQPLSWWKSKCRVLLEQQSIPEIIAPFEHSFKHYPRGYYCRNASTPKFSWIKQALADFYLDFFHSFPGYQGKKIAKKKKMRCVSRKRNAFGSARSVFQNGQLCAEDRFWSRLCFLDTLKKIFCPCFRGRSRNLAIKPFLLAKHITHIIYILFAALEIGTYVRTSGPIQH